MDFFQNVLELIDIRSFSNIWYWMVVAIMWSSLSHFALGVPFDMVIRARRYGGQAMQDLEDLVRISINRRMHVVRISGPWLVGIAATGLTTLAMLGFWYGLQFGQALFLLLAPATAVAANGVMAIARLEQMDLRGEELCRFIAGHRFQVQLIGVVAIFVTAMWGMWQLMSVGVLAPTPGSS